MAFTSLEHGLCHHFGDTSIRWRVAVDRAHKGVAVAVLGGAVVGALAWSGAVDAIAPWSGVALLVGGALIGVPHGTSDFVVAHRLLRPRFGRGWLPPFLVAYLLIVAAVMVGWMVAPLAVLILFVLLSTLHFGHGDLGPGERRHGLAVAVRATTPLLPVLLVHPTGVASLIGVLAGAREPAVTAVLEELHWLVVPWALAVTCYVLGPVFARLRGRARVAGEAEAIEVGAIALAAVVLPPLLGFALYFCLVHAVRHMIHIVDDHEPWNARRAAFLATAIVVPSACVCFGVLALAWNGIAGTLGTADVLAWSLRLIAALTVPHMALEAWAERSIQRGRKL